MEGKTQGRKKGRNMKGRKEGTQERKEGRNGRTYFFYLVIVDFTVLLKRFKALLMF